MNRSALSVHLIFKKLTVSKCQKTNTRGNQKVSPLKPAHVRDEIIKLDGIEYKNQTINI